MATALAAQFVPNTGSVPGKIIIRGTSKLSLKDRFTRLSNEIQVQQPSLRTNDGTFTAAGRRLAQELGNKPAFAAAFRAKKKPVFQRLGVKTRLGIPNGSYRQGGFQQRNGFSPFRRGYYRNAVPSPQLARARAQFAYYNTFGYRPPRNFGPKRMDSNRIGSFPGFGFRRGGFRKRFRGGGWQFGRGGRGRAGGVRNEPLSREELDRQLDEYMAKTKAHLDDDLDTYMGEVASTI